jgi:hypothetical protein
MTLRKLSIRGEETGLSIGRIIDELVRDWPDEGNHQNVPHGATIRPY